MSRRSIVIVGAGHAGVQAAASLREEGSDDAIILLCGEPDLPYQRPPLSKAFLKGAMDLAGLPLRAEQFYREKQIDLRLGVEATRIDLAAQAGRTRRRPAEPFDHLILADRRAPASLRGPRDRARRRAVAAQHRRRAAIRERLGPGRRVVVIGAGFIGLEIAATALALGGDVTVVEIAAPARPRRLAVDLGFLPRGASGLRRAFRFGVGVGDRRRDGRVAAVALTDGERVPADLAIVGVGVLAEDRLARAAGLACDDGVFVDECSPLGPGGVGDRRLRAVSPALARPEVAPRIGAERHRPGTRVARRLTGKPEPYRALPWFWSDQGDFKLQIVGLSHGVDRWALRGDPKSRAFAAFGFRGARWRRWRRSTAAPTIWRRAASSAAGCRSLPRRPPISTSTCASSRWRRRPEGHSDVHFSALAISPTIPRRNSNTQAMKTAALDHRHPFPVLGEIVLHRDDDRRADDRAVERAHAA